MTSPGLLLLAPAVLCLYLSSPSAIPLLTSLCLGLVVYCLDLVGGASRSTSAGGGGGGGTWGPRGGHLTLAAVWLCLLVQCGVHAVVEVAYGEYNSSSGGGSSLLLLIARLAADALLLFNLAVHATLRFQWLPVRMPRVARYLEATACSTLPAVAAATVTRTFAEASSRSGGGGVGLDADTLAMATCHLFAVLLAAGIGLVGSARSEVLGGKDDEDDIKRAASAAAIGSTTYGGGAAEDDKKRQRRTPRGNMAVPAGSGRKLSYALVVLPALVHVATFRARLGSLSTCTFDDVLDLLLISTLPYVYHYELASRRFLHEGWRRSLPLFLRLGTSPADVRTLRGSALPMTVTLVAAVSFEFRHLVPLCARISYIIHGHDGSEFIHLSSYTSPLLRFNE